MTVEDLRSEFGLTLKQARFVQELPACDWNGTEAALKAGYAEGSARRTASENLTKSHIQAALSAYTRPMVRRAEIRAEELLEEYRRLAFSSIADIVSWDEDGRVTMVPSEELPPEVLAAVKKMKSKTTTKQFDDYSETTTRLELEFHSKTQAMDKLGQYLGLWRDPNEIRVQILQLFAQMTPEELVRLESMDDDEVLELIEEHGVWRLPDAVGS